MTSTGRIEMTLQLTLADGTEDRIVRTRPVNENWTFDSIQLDLQELTAEMEYERSLRPDCQFYDLGVNYFVPD